jgi:hypothetical protein
MNEKKHEYQICYVMMFCYFKCYACGVLTTLDYPESYEEAEVTYNDLVREHKHET